MNTSLPDTDTARMAAAAHAIAALCDGPGRHLPRVAHWQLTTGGASGMLGTEIAGADEVVQAITAWHHTLTDPTYSVDDYRRIDCPVVKVHTVGAYRGALIEIWTHAPAEVAEEVAA